MKTLLYAAAAALFISSMAPLSGAVYFVVHPKGAPAESFVVALSDSHDIDHARHAVQFQSSRSFTITAGSTADGVNRNYQRSGAPAWDWRVQQFDFNPSQKTLGPPWVFAPNVEVWTRSLGEIRTQLEAENVTEGRLIRFDNYVFARELENRLAARLKRSRAGVSVTWVDLGSDYNYKVWRRPMSEGSNWELVPNLLPVKVGVDWSQWAVVDGIGYFYKVEASPKGTGGSVTNPPPITAPPAVVIPPVTNPPWVSPVFGQ